MNINTKRLFLSFIALIVLAAFTMGGYFFGFRNATRSESLAAFSKIVKEYVWVAKHIRNEDYEAALGILELNSDHFSSALIDQPDSMMPTLSEFNGYQLNATNLELQASKEEALKLFDEYKIAYPDISERLDRIRNRSSNITRNTAEQGAAANP